MSTFTPNNNQQDEAAVTACSCSFCGAKPMELCKTKSGYIAQFEHGDRAKEWARRAGKLEGGRRDYSAVTPSKARVITIEVIAPTQISADMEIAVREAVALLTGPKKYNGVLAAVVSDQHVEQSVEDAAAILATRECEAWNL